jgi:glycosyltransferase involved in cell wall biosynthesis
MPRYSIVIPTRERADTLRSSLATAMAIEGDDYQVVVQDNASGPGTRAVVESFASPKLVYSRSDTLLPMSENWEMALKACEGEWIHFIGDDDAMMPQAIAALNAVLSGKPELELIAWDPHSYWWPDCIVPHLRNRLFVKIGDFNSANMVNARALEKDYFEQSLDWNMLPMVYNSFVHRRLIDRVREKAGSYFPTIAPDIFSGIANLWAVERFIKLNRPLNMRGTSRHSIGMAQLFPTLGGAVASQFTKEYGDGRPLHRDLIPSQHSLVLLANESCLANFLLHDERSDYALSIPKLVAAMLRSINNTPGTYDETLSDVKKLIAKHKLDPDQFTVPAKQGITYVARSGPVFDEKGVVESLCIDGDIAGLKNVADAVRLATAMVY